MGHSTTPSTAPATTISRDEHRALLNLHMGKIRAANQAVELARAPFDAAREELTATIDEARADLGKKKYTRKRLMGYLEDFTSKLRNLLAEEEQRYQDRIDLGLPVHGEQLSLALGDANTPQEAKDELMWEAEGFLLGRQGKINVIPDGCPPRFHQTVLRAAVKGQELTMADVQAGMELRQKLAEPATTAPVDLKSAEPEPGTVEADVAERKSVRKAKDSLDKLGASAPMNAVAA